MSETKKKKASDYKVQLTKEDLGAMMGFEIIDAATAYTSLQGRGSVRKSWKLCIDKQLLEITASICAVRSDKPRKKQRKTK